MLTRESDERLMALYQTGRLEAFEILFARHRKAVYGFLYRWVGNRAQADDLLQETFLRVVKGATDWKQNAKFTTWLFTIARNHCVDHGRRMKFRKTESLDESDSNQDGAPDRSLHERVADRSAPAHELRLQLQKVISELPEEQREVFVLREIVGLPFAEIAQVTGTAENTLKSRMRYALEKLRASLEDSETASEAVQP